ncbi:Hypothetical predicted protein [Mytilus galloprovincialis]|uniref:Ubiquitin-like protease family profile domain-containing protein n=1 Tax=Mytilus galloprovincialis TaxID=29158 RepID=A0A8B6GXC2_MYTGA|nr:Hypothetical predicted protein [Mytilus galloprovincialis]
MDSGIISRQFPNISGFQPTGLSPVFDEATKSWSEKFGSFSQKGCPTVQIHHTGKSHWVTSLQSVNDQCIYVLDSFSKTFTLTPSLDIQLAAIYGHGKKHISIKLPEVQRQPNGYDCGVYSIANLLEFCFNGGTSNFKNKTAFEPTGMREHLIKCLELGYFSKFPQSLNSCADSVKMHTRKIECSCVCGKPDILENMFGCEGKRGRVTCSKWVHQSCSNVLGDWLCDEHRSTV